MVKTVTATGGARLPERAIRQCIVLMVSQIQHGRRENSVRGVRVPNPRYLAAALVLKAFGVSKHTRIAYRRIGNLVTGKAHARVSASHIAAAASIWQVVHEGAASRNRSVRYLEIGTGWTLFQGLMFRLEFDGRGSLFDVQDCRQLDALRNRFARVRRLLPSGLPDQFQCNVNRYVRLAGIVESASTFEDLLERLDLEYVVDPTGSLNAFADNEFEVIFSSNVLEHVPRSQFLSMACDQFRVLNPEGIAVHHIDFSDHITDQYAHAALLKEYLRFDEKEWQLLFENRIQHMNRLQPRQVVAAFLRAGFEQVDDLRDIDVDAVPLQVAKQWACMPVEDLSCVRSLMVFRKPSTVL